MWSKPLILAPNTPNNSWKDMKMDKGMLQMPNYYVIVCI